MRPDNSTFMKIGSQQVLRLVSAIDYLAARVRDQEYYHIYLSKFILFIIINK